MVRRRSLIAEFDFFTLGKGKRGYTVQYKDCGDIHFHPIVDDCCAYVKAETPQRAIVLAYLKLKGVEVPDGN